MAEHFRRKGLPVPEVFIRSEDEVYYLQEDLGDTLLFNAIEKDAKPAYSEKKKKQLLRKTIRLLPAIQFAGSRRHGLLLLLSAGGVQQPQHPVGLELLQILFPQSNRHGLSGKTVWRMIFRKWRMYCSAAVPLLSCTATSKAAT